MRINGNMKWVVLAVVAIVIGALIAVVYLETQGDETQTATLVAAIFAFLAPTLTALLGILQGRETETDIKDLSRKVDESVKPNDATDGGPKP